MNKRLLCLGIEGTAHTLGMGLVDSGGRILANVRHSYIPPPGKGIHPRDASQHHSEISGKALQETLKQAKIDPSEIDLAAFSMGPGMGPCLRTAATIARVLAKYLGIQLVGVNHILAHIEIARLVTGASDPVVLNVSGGTTQIVVFEKGRYRVFGETLDIAIGNAFDVFAREAGIHDPSNPWPGPKFVETAARGSQYIELPYLVKGMDLAFSGLVTQALRLLKEGHRVEDLCYSLQETALAMLTEVTERAMAHTEKRLLLLTGGSARNKRLQEMLEVMTKERGAEVRVVPPELATDNGVMIAWTGILAHSAGITTPIEKSFVRPRWRIDEVEIPWIR
ncbi:N(6)-L-threonylcarbamoyladenine synthase Kae1 [Candidatus Bathyarchaeota archaeon]|nr:N(6)-L-threonylcarbamoyladenine synthase Kae1 [Candidatus Bathyarchaeota archaeon]